MCRIHVTVQNLSGRNKSHLRQRNCPLPGWAVNSKDLLQNNLYI